MRLLIKLQILLMLFCFFFINCHDPFFNSLPDASEYWYFEPMGTPMYIYLDDDFSFSKQETNKTAIFINGNPLAEDIFVVSETSSGNYDDIVNITNNHTDTVISFYYRKGQRFPWMMNVNSNEKQIIGKLSSYDWSYQRFSIKFEEEINNIDNISLSRDNLLGYTYDTALSINNNIRIRNIHTSLGIYESISRYFLRRDKIISHNIVNTDNIISPAFSDKSILSYIATVTPQELIEIAVSYPEEKLIVAFLKKYLSILPLPPPPPLNVTITKEGISIPNGSVYYLEHEEEMIIDFEFINFTKDTNVNSALYDPFIKTYLPVSNGISYTYINGALFSFTNSEDGSSLGAFTEKYSIKIKRNSLQGFIHDGTVSLVVFFGQEAVVNGSSLGVYFHVPCLLEPELNHSVFFITFTAKQEIINY